MPDFSNFVVNFQPVIKMAIRTLCRTHINRRVNLLYVNASVNIPFSSPQSPLTFWSPQAMVASRSVETWRHGHGGDEEIRRRYLVTCNGRRCKELWCLREKKSLTYQENTFTFSPQVLLLAVLACLRTVSVCPFTNYTYFTRIPQAPTAFIEFLLVLSPRVMLVVSFRMSRNCFLWHPNLFFFHIQLYHSTVHKIVTAKPKGSKLHKLISHWTRSWVIESINTDFVLSDCTAAQLATATSDNG